MSRFTEPSIEQVLLSTDPKRQLVFAEIEFPSGWVRAHACAASPPQFRKKQTGSVSVNEPLPSSELCLWAGGPAAPL